MRAKFCKTLLAVLVYGSLALSAHPAFALSLHPCPCISEAAWEAKAIGWGSGDHYLYNLDAEVIRKYNVHIAHGGTVPLGAESGGSVATGSKLGPNDVAPQAQNLIADQKPVEPMYLDAFADWVVAYELTAGSMKTTVTYDLSLGPQAGFPGDVSSGSVYDFARSSSSQNNLADWIENLAQGQDHGEGLPTAAARALAELSGNPLKLDKNPNIEFVIVLVNGQRIYVIWKKDQAHPEITHLRDKNNNTVPLSPGDVHGNYNFGSAPAEYGQFLQFLEQMGVDIVEPSGGSVWVIACTRGGGLLHCVPTRAY